MSQNENKQLSTRQINPPHPKKLKIAKSRSKTSQQQDKTTPKNKIGQKKTWTKKTKTRQNKPKENKTSKTHLKGDLRQLEKSKNDPKWSKRDANESNGCKIRK